MQTDNMQSFSVRLKCLRKADIASLTDDQLSEIKLSLMGVQAALNVEQHRRAKVLFEQKQVGMQL